MRESRRDKIGLEVGTRWVPERSDRELYFFIFTPEKHRNLFFYTENTSPALKKDKSRHTLQIFLFLAQLPGERYTRDKNDIISSPASQYVNERESLDAIRSTWK